MTDNPSGLPGYPIFLHANEQYTPFGYDLPKATVSEPGSDQLASDFPLTSIAAIAGTVLVMVAAVGITVYFKEGKR